MVGNNTQQNNEYKIQIIQINFKLFCVQPDSVVFFFSAL